MQYASVQDLMDRFGERELIELTDQDELQAVKTPRVQRALDDAQAFVDGFVGRIYSLPLMGCKKPLPVPGDPHAVQYVPPPQLMRICCDVARYYLHVHLSAEHEVYLRFKAAERELQAIADGKTLLSCPWGGAPGQQLAGDAPGEAEVYSSFSRRSVSDDDLRGYA